MSDAGAKRVAVLVLAFVAMFGVSAVRLAAEEPGGAEASEPDAAGVAFFERKIRPVLVAQCYACHSAEAAKRKTLKGGLQLDTGAGMRQGGESGPAVVPGDAKKGTLLSALRHESFEMPPKRKLSDETIADFAKWIGLGAPDPRDGQPVKTGIDFEAARRHWAYQPVRSPAVPVVKDATWTRNDLDRHVLAVLEAKGLPPASDAPAHALLRRMSFAVTGLPPTPAEAVAFEMDYAADADAAVAAEADRLLASPRFGEAWARHWMDGIRYDQLHPTVAHYRDWLIRSLNADLPYDRFVALQLAGDLLTDPPTSDREADDRVVATQMLTLNLVEMDPVEGMIEVVGQQFLGLSIHCAKCHDHKFDAFTQRDYYALAGIFTGTGIATASKGEFPPVELKTNGAKVTALLESRRNRGDTHLLIRGEKSQKGPLVPRRFPVVLAGDGQQPLGEVTQGSGRLELANWIVDARNPLTARVMTNRVWTWTTGRPLVNSLGDFGETGERPIHPDLLDHLATRFVEARWSIKSLIREIVVSRTFRQSSRPGELTLSADPENALLGRMPVRRLTAEQIVDALYFVGDALVYDTPPFDAKLPGAGAPKTSAAAKDRNVVEAYRAVHGVGTIPAAMFDAADPDLLTVRRDESVTAPQMLFFLNNPTVHRLAERVAKRAESAAATDEGTGRIAAATRIVFGRAPRPDELSAAAEFVARHKLPRYCHLLLCASEFCYVE